MQLKEAFECETQEQADEFLSRYITYIFIHSELDTMQEAKQRALDNIGYYSGYMTLEEVRIAEKLFKCKHPMFGTIEERMKLSLKEILEMGKEYGRKLNT